MSDSRSDAGSGSGDRHGTSPEFDRIRPPAERVLRRGDDGHLDHSGETAGDHGDGREVLFSAVRHGTARSGLALRCTRCEQTTDIDARTALKAALPVVVVAPWRRAPLFARCPACRRRSWLSIEVDR